MSAKSMRRCHRVKCSTKERAQSVIFIMAQKGIGPLYPEFCGICRAWHAVRGVRGKDDHGQRSGNKANTHELSDRPDVKTRACGTDD